MVINFKILFYYVLDNEFKININKSDFTFLNRLENKLMHKPKYTLAKHLSTLCLIYICKTGTCHLTLK